MNRRALKCERNWFSNSGTLDRKSDGAARLPTQDPRCFLVRPAFGRLPRDLGDAIPRLEAGALGWTARKWSNHDQPTVTDVYLDSKSGVVTRSTLVEPGKPVGRKECGVRIPELIEHSVH